MNASPLSSSPDTRQVTVLTNGRDLVLGWDGLQDAQSPQSWDSVFDALATRDGWQGPLASPAQRQQAAQALDHITTPANGSASVAPSSWHWLVVTANQIRTVPGDHPPELSAAEGPALVLGVGQRHFVEMDAANQTPVAQRMTTWAHQHYGVLRLSSGAASLANPPPDPLGVMAVLPLPRYHLVGMQSTIRPSTGEPGAYTVLDRWAPMPFADQAQHLTAEWRQQQPGNRALPSLLERATTQLTPVTQHGSTWDVFARPLTSVGPGPFPKEAWEQHPGVQHVLETERRRFLQLTPASPSVATPRPSAPAVHSLKLP